jgi:beta-phosphoglucomutase-like phosphatase (HAD superfamily)
VSSLQVREGEFGFTGADVTEGRTEGWYAALAEAPDRLRASDLNEVLQPDHLDRLRFSNFPLQAYGAVFKWDVLICDVIDVYRTPWITVAEEHGLRVPDEDEVRRAITMRPERAIQQTFMWTNDWGETTKYAFEHFEAKSSMMRTREFEPAEGVVEFLQVLKDYQVPCCLAAGTSFDKPSVESLLEKAGLRSYFETCVTAEDGCETAEQGYLVASIKLKRPPNRVVVFEDDPKGVAAAHEATSKAVALMGSGAANLNGSDLRHADMRVNGCEDLSLMSLRELFKDAPPV